MASRRLPTPYASLRAGRATLRFYHDDALELFARLGSSRVDAIVTSPPYNLGVRYRSYDDTLPAESYQAWTDRWIEAAAGALTPSGSLFLNVGSTPTRPWTALDVAQTGRRHLVLQNTIHWIKSIVVEQVDAGARAGLDRDLAVGHYKPITVSYTHLTLPTNREV